MTREELIKDLQGRAKRLLQVLHGIDEALKGSGQHETTRRGLYEVRVSIGDSNQALHQMDDDELANWDASLERMTDKLRTWLNAATPKDLTPLDPQLEPE